MNDNLSKQQFQSVGRKQIYADDIISREGKGPMRVRSTEHFDSGLTMVYGVHHESGEPMSIPIAKRERARRHPE